MSDAPQEPRVGWCAAELTSELPGLRLLSCTVAAPSGLLEASPRHLRERLRELSNRMRGSRAIALRNEPLPAAQRAFFRQIGLDPDEQRTPIETAALRRMLDGAHHSESLLEDVLLIALLDTRVAVWALDSERLDGELGLRLAAAGEQLQDDDLTAGTLVVADMTGPLAVMFGEIAASHRPHASTSALTLFAIQIPGVPNLFVEEALWSVHSQLEALL